MPTRIRAVRRRCAFALVSVVVASASAAQDAAAPLDAQPFPLSRVRLLDGPFANARDRAREYIEAHDVDRLLAPFRREAGLDPVATLYPNWESSGLGGHTAGHYLTALAQLWAETGDSEARRRLDAMVAELSADQRENGDGYLGGVPGGRRIFGEVAAGRLEVEPFSLNGGWVPWYNLHKTFAGLRDAWEIAGSAEARDVLVGLTDWAARLVERLSDEQVQEMLRAEHGGMNEVFADVFAITGDRRYLELAERFSHRAILDPLLRHEDRLTGLHANTQIPKVVGFARIAELGGDASWRNAARFFWETVTRNRSVALGGNSVREHFNPPDDFSRLIEAPEGPETCNTYNMLRLTEALFRSEPAARYADYYERALYNHILSSIHPGRGGLVYFTPLRPRHYRVYSRPEQAFWCCVGSGMENHTRYGRFVYAHSGDTLWVNLFLASELRWEEQGLTLRQQTRFPDEARTALVLSLDAPRRLTLRVRHPGWVPPDALRVRVNGEDWPADSAPVSYLSLSREWNDGDRVEVDLPMRTAVERLPDGSDYVVVTHGPIVLAAKTGTADLEGLVADDGRFSHVAPGPLRPLEEAPHLIGEPERLAEGIVPVPGRSLAFSPKALLSPGSDASLELVPFFRVHDARYVVYWPTATASEYADVRARVEARERERAALDARTLDRVAPGEQQPEVEHGFRGEGSETGVHLGRRWRDASGWFSYELRVEPAEALELRLTWFGGQGRRSFDVLADDVLVASEQLEGGAPDRFVEVAYPLPPEAVAAAADGALTVRLVAHQGSRVGSLYGLRLLRSEGR